MDFEKLRKSTRYSYFFYKNGANRMVGNTDNMNVSQQSMNSNLR